MSAIFMNVIQDFLDFQALTTVALHNKSTLQSVFYVTARKR